MSSDTDEQRSRRAQSKDYKLRLLEDKQRSNLEEQKLDWEQEMMPEMEIPAMVMVVMELTVAG